jgi:hypothetical protein
MCVSCLDLCSFFPLSSASGFHISSSKLRATDNPTFPMCEIYISFENFAISPILCVIKLRGGEEDITVDKFM